jgi:O-6-methylguanine DNA methyltransferase
MNRFYEVLGVGLDFWDEYPIGWKVQIGEYLAGERREFDVVVDLVGTEFQKAVWREMMKIPYGEVRSYGQIAVAVGRPGAVRAVGTACGRNRWPIIVPCHRVVGSRGLGGFGLGIDLKRKLLELEGVVCGGRM